MGIAMNTACCLARFFTTSLTQTHTRVRMHTSFKNIFLACCDDSQRNGPKHTAFFPESPSFNVWLFVYLLCWPYNNVIIKETKHPRLQKRLSYHSILCTLPGRERWSTVAFPTITCCMIMPLTQIKVLTSIPSIH